MIEINPRRIEQQLRNFHRAVEAYQQTEPFARFLTRFFKENKQMGASDRRMTSRLCYNFFRLGDSIPHLSVVDRLVIAEFLCEEESQFVALYQPEWLPYISAPLTEKLNYLKEKGHAVAADIFPFRSSLSPSVDVDAFTRSHLVQPDLFIRVQQNAKTLVAQALSAHGIDFEPLLDNAYRLPNRSKLQDIRKIDGLYEVQDLSSQQSLENLDLNPGEKWWDACAASGGKSLLLLDRCPTIDLLVSDIRLSTLRNLDERFDKAKIKTLYRKKVLDFSRDIAHLMQGEAFDGILLDVPCSGSGTWGRTPEMLSQFDVDSLQTFAALQRQVVASTVRYLKPGGAVDVHYLFGI